MDTGAGVLIWNGTLGDCQGNSGDLLSDSCCEFFLLNCIVHKIVSTITSTREIIHYIQKKQFQK